MMNQKLQAFKNKAFGTVRACLIDNQPYFVGKDVAEILGYASPLRAIRGHVDKEDKKVAMFDIGGISQDFTVINEAGLYSLILHSNMPNAKQFKRWIFSEVIPGICKHGLFTVDDALANPDFLIDALMELKMAQEEKAQLEQKTVHQKPHEGDLFREFPESLTPEQKLLRTVFGDSEETWWKRENEAREFMSRYIDSFPDALPDAAITVSEMSQLLKEQMVDQRNAYLHELMETDGERTAANDYAYVKKILTLGVIRAVLALYQEEEGDYIFHLCDKGCEAVQFSQKKERHHKC